MKIDNQDIIRMARQLRDEENAQLHVRPWHRHRRFRIPTWLVAIPAAFIGFALGIWTQSRTQSDAPHTALVDTVYIKVPAPQDSSAAAPLPSARPLGDACYQRDARRGKATGRRVNGNGFSGSRQSTLQPTVGRSLADDHIRYDLLVRN